MLRCDCLNSHLLLESTWIGDCTAFDTNECSAFDSNICSAFDSDMRSSSSSSLPGAIVVAKGSSVVDSTIVIGAGDGNVA